MVPSSSSSSYSRGGLSELDVEITICSANILKGYYSDRLNTYAVTWVTTNSNEKCQTVVDRYGDTDPIWNETFVIPLRSASVDQSTLHIKICDYYAKQDDDDGVDVVTIGSVSLPLCEVGICKQAQLKKMEVTSLFGYPRGKLEFKIIVRDHQGTEDYTLPPPPLSTFNPPSAPPLQPPPPPLPKSNPPSAPPLPTFNPPSTPPLPTFKDHCPPSAPLYEDYGYQTVPYYEQLNVLGGVFAVGVGIGLLIGIVLGLNTEMLERVVWSFVFVLAFFFGLMSCCTCED